MFVKFEEVIVRTRVRGSFFQIEQWCLQNIGKRQTLHKVGKWWVGAGWSDYHAFRFRDGTDAMAFKIVWGEG